MSAPASRGLSRNFRTSRLKFSALVFVTGALIGAMTAVLSGEFPAWRAGQIDPLILTGAGAFLVCGLIVAAWSREMFRLGPVLSIDLQGISDSRLGRKRILWSEVRNIRLHRARGRPFLILALREPPEAPAGPMGDPLYRTGAILPGRHTVRVPLTGLDEEPEQVIAAIDEVLTARNRISAGAGAAE